MTEPRRRRALRRAMTTLTVFLVACDGAPAPAPAPATPPADAASAAPDAAPAPAADPRAESVRAWARQQPGFAMKRWDVVLEPPFGVAWEVTGDAKSDARQEQTARAFAVLGRKLHESWRESFAAPLGLPDLASAESPIPFLVTAEPALSDEAWTEHAWRDIFHAPIPTQDLECADGRVQLAGFEPFPRVAARRIVEAQRSIASRGAGDIPHWLRTGLENFLSAVEVDATFRADPSRAEMTRNRVPGVLRYKVRGSGRRDDGDLRGEVAAWTTDLLLAAESADLVAKLGEPSGDRAARGLAFGWRAWTFVSFLWNYDGGRRRPQLLEIVGTAMTRGLRTADVLRTLSIEDAAARRHFDEELRWYSDRSLIVHRSSHPHRVGKPVTEPPAGRYEPDDEE